MLLAMFFDNYAQILKILVVGTLAYIGLVLLLRLTGKRTLSQMNAFDFVVTVALGSTLATAALSKDTPLAEGLTGLGLLVMLQYLVAWLYVRVPVFNRVVKSEPRLLFYRGEFKSRAMQEERVERAELLQAARNQGILSFGQIEAIVLETNGQFSIIKNASAPGLSTLENIARD